MSLMLGTGPFAPKRGGHLNFTRQGPAHVLFFEDSPRRVRVVFNGETVADSRRVKLLHETGLQAVYYFPEQDVRSDLLEPTERTTHCPFKGQASYWSVRVGERVAENAVWTYREPIDGAPPIGGYLAFYWHKMDAWFEEDEEVFVHPRDPYHRVDVLDSSRHVRVLLDGEVLAETSRPRVLFETGLPPRYYIPLADLRSELLVDSDAHTRCPYKGVASYWSVKVGNELVKDLGWYYPEPLPEVATIAGHVAFYNEKVDLEVDGELQERPVTPFS
jgi:uncharacterized protein (DUF427 family)